MNENQYGTNSLPESFDKNDDLNSNSYDEHASNSDECNLIVNYLPHDIDDQSLKNLFQQFGEIAMTKVVRDKNSKKSLGYGFVKFVREVDAQTAIDTMNGYTFGSKVLKVTLARPPSLEIRNCKLYITNLPKNYGEPEVISLFKEFGDIIECRVLKDKNLNANKGVAFVQFNLKAQANNALCLNGCQLEGSPRGLIVKYAEDQHKKRELTRLHNLSMNNPHRDSNPQNVVNEPMSPQYYYPSSNVPIPSMYPSANPISIVHSGMNGGQYFIPPNSANPNSNVDPNGNKKFQKSRKFPNEASPVNVPLPVQSSPPAPNWYPNPQYANPPNPTQFSYIVQNSMRPTPPYDNNAYGVFPDQAQRMHQVSYFENVPGRTNFPESAPNNRQKFDINSNQQINRNLPQKMPNSNYVTLSVLNLPPTADSKLLNELFAPYGVVVNTSIESIKHNNHSSYLRGKVEMLNFAQAEHAAKELNGFTLTNDSLPLQIHIGY